jgi:hypothetical protein
MKNLKSVHECGLVQLRKYIIGFKLHVMSTDDVASPDAKLVFVVDIWRPNTRTNFTGRPSTHMHRCVYDQATKALMFKGKAVGAPNLDEVIKLIEEKLTIFFRRNTPCI